MRSQKYGARRCEFQGYSFASRLERGVFLLLKAMEQAGEIKVLKVQDEVRLSEARIIYKPDFKLWDFRTGCEAWAEAKGFATRDWLMKKKLWASYGPGPLMIFMGRAENPKLVETIIPKGAAE